MLRVRTNRATIVRTQPPSPLTMTTPLPNPDLAMLTQVGFVSVPLYSMVEENLWIGACPQGLVPDPFKFVLSLYQDEPYDHNGRLVLEVWMLDSSDILSAERLHKLAGWVNACAAIGPTLVHCQAGLNRSALIVALALVRRGWSAPAAIARVREARHPACLHNRTFLDWLRGETL